MSSVEKTSPPTTPGSFSFFGLPRWGASPLSVLPHCIGWGTFPPGIDTGKEGISPRGSPPPTPVSEPFPVEAAEDTGNSPVPETIGADPDLGCAPTATEGLLSPPNLAADTFPYPEQIEQISLLPARETKPLPPHCGHVIKSAGFRP